MLKSSSATVLIGMSKVSPTLVMMTFHHVYVLATIIG